MRLKRRAALLILLCGLSPAFAGSLRAEDAATQKPAAQSTATYDPIGELHGLKAYGATHNTCDGWADGCALCARRADGSLGCSRMGIDCEVGPIVCTQKARDPKTGKTPPPQ